MLVINEKVCNDDLNRNQILKTCKIDYTSASDLLQILRILIKCFKIPNLTLALQYLIDINVDLKRSVKYYDPLTKEIYGLLLFGEQSTKNGIPYFSFKQPILSEMLNTCRQIQGAAFIIDERVQGSGIDKKMLKFRNLKETKEMVWCGVNKSLNTHNYWERLGFTNFYEDDVVKFYLKLL